MSSKVVQAVKEREAAKRKAAEKAAKAKASPKKKAVEGPAPVTAYDDRA